MRDFEELGLRRAEVPNRHGSSMAEVESRQSEKEPADGSSLELSPQRPFFPDPGLICIALEAGQIGVWSWDIPSNQATWSTNIEDICGLARGSLDGNKMILEHDVHPETRPAVIAAQQEAMQTRNPRRVRYRLTPKPGADERWIETLATVVVDGGVAIKLLGICHDVSARTNLHRELRIRAKQQEAVARLGAQALTELGLQRFFDDCVKTGADTLDLEMVTILEL